MNNYSQKRNLRVTSPKNHLHTQSSQNKYEFSLHILSVHLSVKFACQMSLEYKNQTLQGVMSNHSTQISSPTNRNKLVKTSLLQQQRKKFIVNGQLNLQGNPPNGIFQITINLTTGKGASYFAGVVRISQKQLLESEGQILSFSLQKCLDNEATCQVRVNQTNDNQKGFSSNRIGGNFQDIKKQQLQTSSGNRNQKFNFNSPSSKANKGNLQSDMIKETYKNTSDANVSPKIEQYKVSREAIHQNQNTKNQRSNLQIKPEPQQNLQQRKGQSLIVIGSTQSDAFQNIEISNFSPKNKNIRPSTSRINQLELEIQDIMHNKTSQKDIQKEKANGPIQKMIRDKNQIIKSLQQKIKGLNNDKARVQETYRKKQASYEQKISQLKLSIERINDSSSQSHNLAKNIAEKNRHIISLESQNRQVSAKLERLTEQLKEMQKSHSSKLLQNQRIAQYEKQSSSATIAKLNDKVKDLNANLKELESNLKHASEEVSRSKSIVFQLQKENLNLHQQIRHLNNQISQNKIYKEVSGEIDNKIKDLQNQMVLSQQTQIKVQRMGSKSNSLNKTSKQNERQERQEISCQNCMQLSQALQGQQMANVQLQEKCKNLTIRNLQLQKNFSILKIQEERARVESESFSRDLEQFKRKEKALYRDLRDFQQKIMSLQNQLQIEKQKSELLELKEKSLRQENQDVKTSNGKIKQLNEQLQIAYNSIQKERDSISFECQKLKMKIKVLQEKQENMAMQAKERQNQVLDKLSKSEKEVITLKSKVNALLQSNQEFNDEIHNKELESLKNQMDLENYRRQIKEFQEKVTDSTNFAKNRQTQLYQLISKDKQKQLKIEHLKQDFSGLKDKYNHLLNEFNNVVKTNQTLENQKQEISIANSELAFELEQRRKAQQKMREETKNFKVEIHEKQSKLSGIQREYESYQKKVKEIIALIPYYSNSMTESREVKQVGLQKSRASMIDQLEMLDIEKSIIYQMPITHFQYRQLDQKVTLSDMKKIVVQFVQESQKNISNLQQQIRLYQLENQRMEEELAQAKEIAHKNQQSLFAKMKQFSEEIQEMANSYNVELKNNEENIRKLKRQLKKKEQDCQESNKQSQKCKKTAQQEKQKHQATNQALSKKYDNQVKQLKGKIQQLQMKNEFSTLKNKSLSDDIKEMQKQVFTLKKTVEEYQDNIKRAKNGQQKRNKEISMVNDEVKALKIQVQNYKANKLIAFKQLKSMENQNNRLKDTNMTLQQNVKDKENLIKILREKNDQSLKEKEIKMKAIFEKESQMLKLNQQLSVLNSQNAHLKQTVKNGDNKITQLKEIIRELNTTIRQVQDQTKMTQKKTLDISERVGMYQRQLNQKDLYIQELQQKNLSQLEQFSKKKTQFLKTLQQENQKYKKIINDKNTQFIELEKKFQKIQSRNKKNQERNAQLQEMIYVERHKVMQQEQIAEGLAVEKQELEKRQEELQGMYCDLTEETKEKQERMFSLSSKAHELQLRIKQLQRQNAEAIQNLNTKWQGKMRNLAEEYQNRFNNFDKDQIRHYQSQKQFSLLIPHTHSRDKLEIHSPRQREKEKSKSNAQEKDIQRERSHSPINSLQIERHFQKSKEKFNNSSMMRKSRGNDEREKNVSHQYSTGLNSNRKMQYFDSDQAIKEPASSYIASRNSVSRKEVRKYEPGMYRRNQRYN